jgi:hypothetical protein
MPHPVYTRHDVEQMVVGMLQRWKVASELRTILYGGSFPNYFP